MKKPQSKGINTKVNALNSDMKILCVLQWIKSEVENRRLSPFPSNYYILKLSHEHTVKTTNTLKKNIF